MVPRRFYDSAAELKQAVLSALRLLGQSSFSVCLEVLRNGSIAVMLWYYRG